MPDANVKLGALVTDDGELEVFVFDSTTFEKLSSNVNYTVTASLQDIGGVLPIASRMVSQAINSAIKISYKEAKKALARYANKSLKQPEIEPSIELEVIY